MSFFSAYEDTVIVDTFLMIGGAAFKRTLLEETDKVAMASPDRVKRLFINGAKHTTLGDIHATTLNGVDIAEWTRFMLDADPQWTDMLQ